MTSRDVYHCLKHTSGLVLLVCLLLLSGCGKSQKTTYKVKGQVFDSTGEPAKGLIITFQPVTADANDSARPTATVDENGNYTLTTYTAGDGAPAGEYAITLVWPKPRKTPFEPAGGDLLEGRYDRQEKAIEKHTVTKSPDQTVPPIKLP